MYLRVSDTHQLKIAMSMDTHICVFVSPSANKCIFKCDLMFYTFVVVLDGIILTYVVILIILRSV